MTVLALGARAAIAVVLLAAGGAKLADPASFGTAVALFVPARMAAAVRGIVPAIAAVLIGSELAAGAISLCWPAARWAGLAVLVLAAGFTVVASLGYLRHRGRDCRCFGALTRRGFTGRSLAQALLILAIAVLACWPVSHGAGQTRLGLAAHLLLLAAAAMLVLAARTAARALAEPARSLSDSHLPEVAA